MFPFSFEFMGMRTMSVGWCNHIDFYDCQWKLGLFFGFMELVLEGVLMGYALCVLDFSQSLKIQWFLFLFLCRQRGEASFSGNGIDIYWIVDAL